MVLLRAKRHCHSIAATRLTQSICASMHQANDRCTACVLSLFSKIQESRSSFGVIFVLASKRLMMGPRLHFRFKIIVVNMFSKTQLIVGFCSVAIDRYRHQRTKYFEIHPPRRRVMIRASLCYLEQTAWLLGLEAPTAVLFINLCTPTRLTFVENLVLL
jgi:hypothetical protein